MTNHALTPRQGHVLAASQAAAPPEAQRAAQETLVAIRAARDWA
jgi:hypothetical protein